MRVDYRVQYSRRSSSYDCDCESNRTRRRGLRAVAVASSASKKRPRRAAARPVGAARTRPRPSRPQVCAGASARARAPDATSRHSARASNSSRDAQKSGKRARGAALRPCPFRSAATHFVRNHSIMTKTQTNQKNKQTKTSNLVLSIGSVV